MATQLNITPCLWFDDSAEDAAKFYVSIFPNSGIDTIARYGKEGYEFHRKREGTVMTVAFQLDGRPFTALNGGPRFKFSEAFSLQVFCDTQAEIDHYWSQLTSGGGKESMCGWLQDKFGFSWQIIPSALSKMMADPDAEKVQRVTQAFLQMRKFDLATIERAHRG